MSSELDTIEESIKIALDAADAATDITSEYNKVKREHKKLEAKVKQIHRYTTIIFGSSILASKGSPSSMASATSVTRAAKAGLFKGRVKTNINDK